jgi:hypothetical protein
MKRLFVILAVLFVSVFTGCKDAQVITGEELGQLKTQWKEPKVSIWYYVGSKGGYHYFLHMDLGIHKTYRISEKEQKIDDPFSLTADETSWRFEPPPIRDTTYLGT